MAKKLSNSVIFTPKPRQKRRSKARPLNHQKTLGPRSSFRGSRKRNRGQGRAG